MAEANPGVGDRVAFEASHNLGNVLLAMGRLDARIGTLRLTLEICEQHFGPLDPETISTLSDLGAALPVRGQLDEARQRLETAVERSIHVYGFCHIKSAGPLGGLQDVIASKGISTRSAIISSIGFPFCSPPLSKRTSTCDTVAP